MSFVLLLPFAVVAGVAVPAQFAVNTQLRNVAGGPLVAAAISFFVGTVVLVAAALVVDRTFPQMAEITGSPWWVWTGGLLGAFFVSASILLTPRLGAATTIGLFLAGQMIGSVLIDHFGLFRLPVQDATLPRLLGVLLILLGVFFVQKF